MIEQFIQLAKQYATPLVDASSNIDNQQIENVSREAGTSIIEGLQGAVNKGNIQDIISMFRDGNVQGNSVTNQISDLFQSKLGNQLGIENNAAQGLSASLIPTLLEAVVGKSKSGASGFDIGSIIQAIGGNGNSGLMDLVSKYGGQFGLDQNGDGKVDLNDAISMISGNSNSSKKESGGLGGLLGKIFGK